MGSVTSCCNSTMYRKTMQRFWPLWALYGVIWLFMLPLQLMTRYFDAQSRDSNIAYAQAQLLDAAQDIPESLTAGVFLALVFGVLAAMACFGYLYNNRSACMMHALPMRRGTLFTSQYLAGLSCLMLPQVGAALLALAAELALLPTHLWGAVLPPLGTWLLAQSAIALFFFSFAAFCAMFTGHILALPAFYGILNILVYVIYYLVSMLMGQFFYGMPRYVIPAPIIKYLTPAYALLEASGWDLPTGLSDPPVLAIYAGAGVVLAVLARMVYRHRHVESAGDVVAIPLVRPVFLCGVSFCSGLCVGSFSAAFFGVGDSPLPLTLHVLFWAAVGWFVAEMLLRKSFRVLSAWKGCVAMVAVLALLCTACFLDVFGVEDRVPSAGQVTALTVTGNVSYPYDSGRLNLHITDPDQIQKVIDLHHAILQDESRPDEADSYGQVGDDYISLTITYALAGGSSMTREYYSVPIHRDALEREGSVTFLANQLLQDRDLVAQCYNFDYYQREGRLAEVWLSDLISADQPNEIAGDLYLNAYAQQLWDAALADFREGTLGVRYLFEDEQRLNNTYVTDLIFSFEIPEGADRSYITTLAITLTPQASHVLQVLEGAQELEGYEFRTHTWADEAYEATLAAETAEVIQVY